MSAIPDMRVPHSNAVGYLASPAIGVVVGQDPNVKEFFVHQDLICARSQFFKNAMTEPWKEVEDRKISLANEVPDIFSLYMELLYTNVLPVKETTNQSIAAEYIALCELYVLAEMLMDDATKDTTVAAILSRSKEPSLDDEICYPGPSCIEIVYGGTPEDSPARRLLVDLYTAFGDDTFNLAENSDLPKDFFFDLSVSLLSKRPSPVVHEVVQAKLSSLKKMLVDMGEQAAASAQIIRTIKAEKKMLEEDLANSNPYSGRKERPKSPRKYRTSVFGSSMSSFEG